MLALWSQALRWDADQEEESIGPGRYKLDSYNSIKDAPGFALPVNECLPTAIGLELVQKDIIVKHVRAITKGRLNKEANAERRAVTARTQRDRMASVGRTRERLQQGKLEHKVHLCGRWEQIAAQNKKKRDEEATRNLHITAIMTNAVSVVTHGARIGMLYSILARQREQLYNDKLLFKSARLIQRSYRTAMVWRKMIAFHRLEQFKVAVRHFLFRTQFEFRMLRRKLVSLFWQSFVTTHS